MPICLEYDETNGELKDQRPESWNRNVRHVAPARLEAIVLLFTLIRAYCSVQLDAIHNHRAGTSPETSDVNKSAVDLGFPRMVGYEIQITIWIFDFVIGRGSDYLIADAQCAGSQLKRAGGR